MISPFFASLGLQDHGLEWVYPKAEVAHPLDGGGVAMIYRSIQATVASRPGSSSLRRLTNKEWSRSDPVRGRWLNCIMAYASYCKFVELWASRCGESPELLSERESGRADGCNTDPSNLT